MHDDELEGSSDAASLGLWQLVGLGSMFVGFIVAGLVLGELADRRWGTSPTFVLVGISVGIVGSTISSWIHIKPFLQR